MSERGQGARPVSAYREYWQMEGVVCRRGAEGTSWNSIDQVGNA
jgi:hypothetical protein